MYDKNAMGAMFSRHDPGGQGHKKLAAYLGRPFMATRDKLVQALNKLPSGWRIPTYEPAYARFIQG